MTSETNTVRAACNSISNKAIEIGEIVEKSKTLDKERIADIMNQVNAILKISSDIHYYEDTRLRDAVNI